MEDLDGRVLGLKDEPLSVENYNLRAIQQHNLKIQSQLQASQKNNTSVLVPPRMARLSDIDQERYVHGFVSRHVALPQMINPRARSLLDRQR